MPALHTLGDYLQHAGHKTDTAQSPASASPRMITSICTEHTDWTLTPVGSSRRHPTVSVARRTATVRGRSSTIELHRVGRSAILELSAASATPNGPVTVSAIFHTRTGVKLAWLARNRARRVSGTNRRPGA